MNQECEHIKQIKAVEPRTNGCEDWDYCYTDNLFYGSLPDVSR